MIQTEPQIARRDMIRCALCDHAPCDDACGALHPSRLLRSIWFRNEQGAALCLPPQNPCVGCDGRCERACVRPGQVPVRALIQRLYSQVLPQAETPLPTGEDRLKTDLCGVPLQNPFLLSSSVVASTYDMCARAFDAGWAGACFKTVCTLDIHEASPRFSALFGDGGGIAGFKNVEQLSDHSVEENMAIFRQLKKNYPDRVIIASIMGQNDGEWTALARMCQENGADAVELNFSCPNMADGGLGSDIGQDPALVERFTACARKECTLPLLVKPTPNVASMLPMGLAARRAGADGFALINTIKSVVGINLHTYVSAPAVRGVSAVGGYSGNAVKPIALRFLAELAGDSALRDLHFSGMGGIETWQDAAEFLLLGARSLQVTTAVMQYGYRIVEDLKEGLNLYMAEKGFASVGELCGLGLASLSSTTDVLERDTVLYPRFVAEKCIGCGRCAISCADGGHQAIHLDSQRRPRLDGRKCVGCHLCLLVCPQRAIRPAAKRVPLRR